MKIRNDFVTNSSSSCFVCITVEMLDGKRVSVNFDSGDQNVDPEFEKFTFDGLREPGAEQSGRKLLQDAADWMASMIFNEDENFISYFKSWAYADEKVKFIESLESFDKVKRITAESGASFDWWGEYMEENGGEDEAVAEEEDEDMDEDELDFGGPRGRDEYVVDPDVPAGAE